MRDGVQAVSVTPQHKKQYAPKKWLSPKYVYKVDYSVFAKNKNDKVIAQSQRANFELEMKREHGVSWRRVINKLNPPTKMTF